MRHILAIVLLAGLVSCASTSNKKINQLSGVDHNNKSIEVNTKDKKATVVVFLSSICPCSNSHVSLLRKMNKEHIDIQFVGIHSNYNEDLKRSQKYFKNAKLNFPVIHDKDTTLAKRLGGVKTPHAFILDKNGKVIYTGSVTSSSNAAKAKENFLLMALNEIEAGKEVSIPKRKTLGCYIPTKE